MIDDDANLRHLYVLSLNVRNLEVRVMFVTLMVIVFGVHGQLVTWL